MKICVDCSVDISMRKHNALRCKECALNLHRKKGREYYREKNPIKLRYCKECDVSIDDMPYRFQYCVSCVRITQNRYSLNYGNRMYRENEEFREKRKQKVREYSETEEGKALRKTRYERVRDTVEYREQQCRSNYKYSRTEKGRANANKHWHLRRARMIDQVGEVSDNIRDILFAAQNGICVGCKRLFNDSLKPTLDHIIPLIRGGLHDDTNLQLLCFTCNSGKGAKVL